MPPRPQQPPRGHEARPADVVEDGVHPVRRDRAHLRGDVAVIVDRGHPERRAAASWWRAEAEPITVAPASSGELDQGRADTAVGPEHQDGLPGPHPRLAVQHLPGGDAVDHDGLGVDRGDPGRHLDQIGRVDQQVAAPAADLGQGGHPAPDQRRRRRPAPTAVTMPTRSYPGTNG